VSPKSNSPATPRSPKRLLLMVGLLFAMTTVATLIVTAVLVTMFEHKQDARSPYLRIQELDEVSTDPALWAKNWPHHFDQYKQTAGDEYYGGSSALPESKLDKNPWLRRLYAGYAFAIDYREARGHAYMLNDQILTQRVTERPQAGACLHCHASATVLYRQTGLKAMGLPHDDEVLAADFNREAVIRGFKELSQLPYHETLALLTQVPDGSPRGIDQVFPTPQPQKFGALDAKELEAHLDDFAISEAHPVSCIDCHDPKTMAVRVTRPGFMLGIAALAESDEPVPHMPSVEAWRRGNRSEPYDPNKLATRQEMRSFACGQCHVEYYCANKDTLTFPWGHGLKIEQIEQFWAEKKFPDGSDFHDYIHAETGAPLLKAQHPEFELWSQGIHARAGVSCADCHMPYERTGAMKLSNHNVRSPMENINNACQVCHNVPEKELEERVRTIQGRTVAMMDRAADAMTEMLDAILEAQAAGVSNDDLVDVFELQRKAMWRLDFISSENSKGFHADQEATRILGESIDYSRQATALALRLRAGEAPKIAASTDAVIGVTER
jgi:nitrite reductase (cytochrome c-552)